MGVAERGGRRWASPFARVASPGTQCALRGGALWRSYFGAKTACIAAPPYLAGQWSETTEYTGLQAAKPKRCMPRSIECIRIH